MPSADSTIAEAFAAVAERMTATLPAGARLRERLHLDPLAKDEFARRTGVRPVTRRLSTPAFPGLGPVDVVLERPRALIELKWSYALPGKVFESVWDATKLLLLGERHGYEALYLATGAAGAEWAASESADLFRVGEVDAIETWSRPLVPKRGPNHGATVGEDLVIGAHGNHPLQAHARIAVEQVFAFPVADGYELRVARIAAAGPVVPWPSFAQGARVTDTSAAPPGPYPLPRRVTQQWIERTAPGLRPNQVSDFLAALRIRGWSDRELQQRVIRHLPSTG